MKVGFVKLGPGLCPPASTRIPPATRSSLPQAKPRARWSTSSQTPKSGVISTLPTCSSTAWSAAGCRQPHGPLETTGRLQTQTFPWRGGKCLPPSSLRGGNARAPSQANYSCLNFKHGTTKINSMGTSLKPDHTAKKSAPALKSIALNPGRPGRASGVGQRPACWASAGRA